MGEALTKNLIRKLFLTVEHLHSRVGVAHLDLKMENILFDTNFNIKICDFGFSEETNTRLYEMNGTQGYMAPEMLHRFSSNGYSAV